MDPTFPLAPIANFLGIILGLVPLLAVAHVRNSANIAIYFFTMWISIECLNHGVNAIVWRDNVNNPAPIWCDITSRIDVCFLSGTSGCSLAIARNLYKIISYRSQRFITHSRRDTIIDCVLCCGLPLICGAVYYIVQDVRFLIFEEMGCDFSAYPSGVTILLVYAPPLLLCIACLICYLPALVRVSISRRRELSALFDGNRALNRKHYTRVLLMVIAILITVLVEVGVMFYSLAGLTSEIPLRFWPGWEIIHTNWQPVGVPASEWKQLKLNHFMIHWREWKAPILAYMFFAVYGLSSQVRERYASILSTLLRLRTSSPESQAEDPSPRVVQLRSGGLDLSVSSANSNTNMNTKTFISSSGFDRMEIKVEQQTETNFDPSLSDVEKGQHKSSREPLDGGPTGSNN